MSSCREMVPLIGAHADGELSRTERETVEQHLGGCGECRERVKFFAAQGTALRQRVVSRAAEADFSRLTDRVMARVAKQASPPAAERLSLWTREMWGAHRAMVATAGSFALAACLALVVLLQPTRGDDFAQQAELLADAAQTQVDEVDFGTHDGAVMRLQDKTQVIWLGEDHPQ